jgi:general secretion pathway protein I
MIARLSKNGFTLLEVMAALAIVAVALVTLLGSHLVSLDLALLHKEQSLGSMFAGRMMRENMTVPYDDLESATGDFSPDYPEIGWETEISDADIDNLKKVVITIRMPGGDFKLGSLIARTSTE